MAVLISTQTTQETQDTPEEATITEASITPITPMIPDGWRSLSQMDEEERARTLSGAQNGNAEALRCVLWSMALEPERGAAFLDFPTQIRRNMIEASTDPRNGLVSKTVETQCEMLRADLLASCAPTPLERLLVDRIVTCWLAAYLADGTAAMAGRYGGRDGEYHLRRQDRAHKRLLQSIEALARVQRLMRPGPLVAMQQVNIAAAMLKQ